MNLGCRDMFVKTAFWIRNEFYFNTFSENKNKNTMVFHFTISISETNPRFQRIFKAIKSAVFYRDVQMFLPDVLLWLESQNYIFSANYFLCFLKVGGILYTFVLKLSIFIGLKYLHLFRWFLDNFVKQTHCNYN